MKYCKIVEHEQYGQILALRENNDDCEPSIRVMIKPDIEDVDLFSTSFSYDDSEGGAETRDRIWEEQYLSNDSLMIKTAEILTAQIHEIFGAI